MCAGRWMSDLLTHDFRQIWLLQVTLRVNNQPENVMQELKNSYLRGVLTLLLLVRLGFSQNIFNKDTSSKADDEKAVKFLQELSKRKALRNITRQNSNIKSTDLHNIVVSRFRKEMAILFSWQPDMKQSELLETVSKATSCSMSDIAGLLSNLTKSKHNVNVSYPFDRSWKNKSCNLRNTKVFKLIDHTLSKMFQKLPSPFKCNVINTVAMAYNLKRRRHLSSGSVTLFVSEAQNAVEKLFPLVTLPQTCTEMEVHHLIPSIPPVNITVNLTSGEKKMWLTSLTKKGPIIYQTLLEYERETYHKDKVLGPGSTADYLAQKKEIINSAQLIIVGVHGGSRKFSISFRLKVKRKLSNHLRELRSTYKIVQALVAKKQKGLREIFNVNVISISLSRQRSNKTKSPPESNEWTLKQIDKAKELFPEELSEYYKHLGKPARCFVVLYISIKIKKSPKAVEMFYSSFRRLSRKHSCYYIKRTAPTNTTIKVTVERFTQKNTLTTRIPTETNRTVIPPQGNDNKFDISSEQVTVEDFPPLEIALFALLGLLCIVIVAFTINCMVSALKSKSAQNNTATKDSLQAAVFLESASMATTGSSENDGVHYVSMIQRKGRGLKQCTNQHHLAVGNSSIGKSQDCLKLYALQRSEDTDECNEQICSKALQCKGDSDRENISAKTRTHKENEYVLESSELHTDGNNAMESPWKRRSSFKIACHPSWERVDHGIVVDDTLLQSQGQEYCEMSNQRSKGQPHVTDHSGHSSSKQSEEMVAILLNYVLQGVKEEQV